MYRYLIVIPVGMLTILMLPAPSASAAIEVGDDCLADAVEMNKTLIARDGGRPFSLEPVVSEGGMGVITRWGVRVAAGQPSIPQRLEIYRSLMGPKDAVRKEAEAQLQTLHAGENSFQSRISVSVATELGLYGPEGTFACHTQESVSAWVYEGNMSVGGSMLLTGLNGFRTPITVVVETDRDGDGYGDESQDGCPAGAAYQSACPMVSFSVKGRALENSIAVWVNASAEASIRVTGQVGWVPKARGHNQPKSKGRRLIIALAGRTHQVKGGQPARFTVPLPQSVQRRLSRIPSNRSLIAKLQVEATDLAGRESYKRLRVNLPSERSG
jgi:hypothetical protein